MLASTAALRLVPGAKPQQLHRDQIAYLVRHNPAYPLYTPMVGCLIAGSKCTRRNGATAVIPGSHVWDDSRAPKVEECTYAEMEPGSALFTLGSTYHGAGENKCELEEEDSLRTIFAVFGQRDYYRQDQEEVLSTPIEIVRQLPEDILKLCGFCKRNHRSTRMGLTSSQGGNGGRLRRGPPIGSRIHPHRFRHWSLHCPSAGRSATGQGCFVGRACIVAGLVLFAPPLCMHAFARLSRAGHRLVAADDWLYTRDAYSIHVPIYSIENAASIHHTSWPTREVCLVHVGELVVLDIGHVQQSYQSARGFRTDPS